MKLFLNELFYPCNNFDNIDSIKKLELFMLTNSNVEKMKESKPLSLPLPVKEPDPEPLALPVKEPAPLPVKEPAPLLVPIKKINKKDSNPYFYPRREDSLFWCLFISFHGIEEFHFIGKKYANREMDEKKQILDTIKKTPSMLKETNYKVTNVLIQEILSDLLINRKTQLSILLAFVAFYKKRFF